MRTLPILLFFAVLNHCILPDSSVAQEWSWTWEYPRPTGVPGVDIEFIDTSNGWFLGYYNTLVRTRDGGRSWEAVTEPEEKYFHSYSQPTFMEAVSTDVVYLGYHERNSISFRRTTDGGQTWKEFDTAIVPKFTALTFVSPTHGWGKVDTGSHLSIALYETRDAGETWVKLESSLRGVEIVPVDQRLVFLNTRDSLCRSTDAGRTWNRLPLLSPAYLTFLDTNRGWAYSFGELRNTTDGGKTWAHVRSESSPSVKLYWMYFFTPQTGVRKLFGDYYERTTDGGVTWAWDSSTLWDVSVLDTSYIDGSLLVYDPALREIVRMDFRTGTMSWLTDRGQVGPQDIHFFDDREGIVLFSGADVDHLLWRTEDGGATWKSEPGYGNWTEMDAVGDTVWATRRTSLTVSYDRGRSWKVVLDGLNVAFSGIALFDGQSGVVTAWDHIMTFSEGGETWEFISLEELYGEELTSSVYARAAQGNRFGIAWIDVIDRLPLLTTDYGKSWQPRYITSSLFFLTDSIGYMAGNPIRRTVDRGATWFPVTSVEEYMVSGSAPFYMFDRNRGLFVNGFELVMTDDGGASFARGTLLPTTAWSRIVCPDSLTCWIVGDAGLVKLRREGPSNVRPYLYAENPTDQPDRIRYPFSSLPYLTLTLSCNDGEVDATLVDVQGRSLLTSRISVVQGKGRLRLSPSLITPGFYTLLITEATGTCRPTTLFLIISE